MVSFVATPIGNLKDITLRALETLKSVDIIACEDTRHSLKLLNAYEIKKPLFAYHKFNEKVAGEKLVELLKDGKEIALITDAGMPVISDPGNTLVKMLIENGLEYTVVPGASAFTSALVLSGLDASEFCFIGFLPDKKKDKEKKISVYKDLPSSLVFYTAPHDIKENVDVLFSVLGERKAVAVREITKLHEERQEFNLSQGYVYEPKGVYVLIVEGASEKENKLNALSVEEHLQHYIDEGLSKMDALKAVAKDRGVSKSSLYKYTL